LSYIGIAHPPLKLPGGAFPAPPVVKGGRTALAGRLAGAGCVAPFDEADELVAASGGDEGVLEQLVVRRLGGEPLAWVTGCVSFAGHRVLVHPGVYVPRRQSERLARRGVDLLPETGLALDLCTGSGAIALALGRARPRARVLASEIDARACLCAAANGVEVLAGHLADPLPADLRGHLDLVIGVVPYVPTAELVFLPRDVRDYEPVLALDGGPRGTLLLEEAVWAAAGSLHGGGWLLLEVGGDEGALLAPILAQAGFGPPLVHRDSEGDVRGIEAQLL
jgi:release factor glutamine methyltransferase